METHQSYKRTYFALSPIITSSFSDPLMQSSRRSPGHWISPSNSTNLLTWNESYKKQSHTSYIIPDLTERKYG